VSPQDGVFRGGHAGRGPEDRHEQAELVKEGIGDVEDGGREIAGNDELADGFGDGLGIGENPDGKSQGQGHIDERRGPHPAVPRRAELRGQPQPERREPGDIEKGQLGPDLIL